MYDRWYNPVEDSTYVYWSINPLPPDTLIDAFVEGVSYTNSSSDPTVLKYRYKHIAKLDAEILYKNISFAGSYRYNDFMSNIDYIFTIIDKKINDMKYNY